AWRPARSSQLQGRETEQHEHHGDDPEPHHDLGYLEAAHFEVMAQRSHPEDALADAEAAPGVLEVAELQHHGERLHDEDAAHDEEHDLLAHHDRHGAERTAERERADIAHEHLRGVGIEPEESEPGADDGPAEHRELARADDVRDEEVLREHGIAA